jgi:hypothetical protein
MARNRAEVFIFVCSPHDCGANDTSNEPGYERTDSQSQFANSERRNDHASCRSTSARSTNIIEDQLRARRALPYLKFHSGLMRSPTNAKTITPVASALIRQFGRGVESLRRYLANSPLNARLPK